MSILGIILTKEEMELVREGKLNPANIEEYRKEHPVVEKKVDLSELDQVKQEIRETNVLYKAAIQKNKDLYKELVANRKRKEEFRNKITELREKKKKLLGLSD